MDVEKRSVSPEWFAPDDSVDSVDSNYSDYSEEKDQLPIKVAVVNVAGEVHTQVLADFLSASGQKAYRVPVRAWTDPEDDEATLWLDEEGIPKRLHENHLIRAAFGMYEPVFGDVIVTGGCDEDGNMLAVPDKCVECLEACAAA